VCLTVEWISPAAGNATAAVCRILPQFHHVFKFTRSFVKSSIIREGQVISHFSDKNVCPLNTCDKNLLNDLSSAVYISEYSSVAGVDHLSEVKDVLI
jgi:hypothetical protein